MSCVVAARKRALSRYSVPLVAAAALLSFILPAQAQEKKEGAIPLDAVTVEGQAKQASKPKGKKAAAKKAPTQPVAAPVPMDLTEGSGSGEDVRVVSSGKREADPLDVPAGIDVGDTSEFDAPQFHQPDRPRPRVHRHQHAPAVDRAYTNITVRGQSSVDFYNPSVGIYIDGLPQDQTTSAKLLPLGLEHVELLYGPQGTLYGRNSIGGVLDVVTRRPGNEPHFQSFTEVSNLERGGGVLVSAPLIKDVLYGDVALAYKMEEGEYVDQLTLEGLDNAEGKNHLVHLRYAPKGGPLDVMVMAARSHVSSKEEHYVPEAFIQQRLSVPDAFFPSTYRLETNSFGLTASYDLGGAKVSSRTGYQDRVFDRLTTGFYTPEDQETFNQEVTIASNPGPGQPLDYLFGLYYRTSSLSASPRTSRRSGRRRWARTSTLMPRSAR